jgi:HEAT repeat protein
MSTVRLILIVFMLLAAGRAKVHSKETTKMLQAGLQLLLQKEPEAIFRGVELLAQSERPEAIQALLPLLRSRSEAVADCVRHALDRMDVAPLLLNQWRSSDGNKRAEALSYAAVLTHPGLMEIYRQSIHEAAADLREKVAIGLKRQEPTAEVLHLLAMLAADPNRDVRWWAIDSLGILGSPEAISILEDRRAKESDVNLNPFIERALGRAQSQRVPRKEV